MVQWINVLWNNSCVNPLWLTFLCEKTGALALAQLGLTDRQAGRLADEILLHLEILEIIYWMKHWKLAVFRKAQCHYSGIKTF